MKVAFFGTPKFVDPILAKLQENFDVVSRVRGPIKFDKGYIEDLKKLDADIFLVAAYGQILPKEVIDTPKLGTINIHPSLLPKYRGASPVQSAILAGDDTTGVSFIRMDEEMDHGPIINQFPSEILPSDTFESLVERLFLGAAEKLPEAISKIGKAKPQDDSGATFTKILKREDGMIDLGKAPDNGMLKRMIRAYYPWPGVWFKLDLKGKETVIKLLPEDMIQVEGKKPMSYKDFKNGYEIGGEILSKLGLS